MGKILHPIAGNIAFLLISTFWLSTVFVELFGSQSQLAALKSAILWGMAILIPCLAVTGGTGLWRAKGRHRGVVLVKARRLRIVAANGLLVLLPYAFFLARWADMGDFGPRFYVIQTIELLAGGVNLTLLALCLREGLRMTGRLRQRRRPL